jgi:hypothetical protein
LSKWGTSALSAVRSGPSPDGSVDDSVENCLGPDPAMKCTKVASDERMVVSCRSRRMIRLGANDSMSFRSSDIVRI